MKKKIIIGGVALIILTSFSGWYYLYLQSDWFQDILVENCKIISEEESTQANIEYNPNNYMIENSKLPIVIDHSLIGLSNKYTQCFSGNDIKPSDEMYRYLAFTYNSFSNSSHKSDGVVFIYDNKVLNDKKLADYLKPDWRVVRTNKGMEIGAYTRISDNEGELCSGRIVVRGHKKIAVGIGKVLHVSVDSIPSPNAALDNLLEQYSKIDTDKCGNQVLLTVSYDFLMEKVEDLINSSDLVTSVSDKITDIEASLNAIGAR